MARLVTSPTREHLKSTPLISPLTDLNKKHHLPKRLNYSNLVHKVFRNNEGKEVHFEPSVQSAPEEDDDDEYEKDFDRWLRREQAGTGNMVQGLHDIFGVSESIQLPKNVSDMSSEDLGKLHNTLDRSSHAVQTKQQYESNLKEFNEELSVLRQPTLEIPFALSDVDMQLTQQRDAHSNVSSVLGSERQAMQKRLVWWQKEMVEETESEESEISSLLQHLDKVRQAGPSWKQVPQGSMRLVLAGVVSTMYPPSHLLGSNQVTSCPV